MEPDAWPIAAAQIYDLASRGGEVDGGVRWIRDGQTRAAHGRMKGFHTVGKAGTLTLGLRGTLATPFSSNPAPFQPMELEIKKVGPDNATAEVTLTSSGERKILDDPRSLASYYTFATSSIYQWWDEGHEFVDIWLTNVWAEHLRLHRISVERMVSDFEDDD